MDIKIGVITEAAPTYRHGTGAQLLHLFKQPGFQPFFLYLEGRNWGTSDDPNAHLLDGPYWYQDLPRGGGLIHRIRQALGMNWRNKDGTINAAKLAALRRKYPLDCDLIYITAADENFAASMSSIARAFGKPYIVHMMDLYQENGLTTESTPHFAELLGGASEVIGLHDALSTEALRVGVPASKVHTIPIGQALLPSLATAPTPGEPLRILIVGRPYIDGCEILAGAIPALKQRVSNVKFLYAGSRFIDLPAALQRETENVGLIEDRDEYARFLTSCHIGYLTGPYKLDIFGKYSFPSRSSDYLMAGLPMIAAVAHGSATEKILMPIIDSAVRVTRTADDVTAATAHFADPEVWQSASHIARRFAEDNLSIETVRTRVYSVINSVLSPESGKFAASSKKVPNLR